MEFILIDFCHLHLINFFATCNKITTLPNSYSSALAPLHSTLNYVSLEYNPTLIELGLHIIISLSHPVHPALSLVDPVFVHGHPLQYFSNDV